MHMHMRVCMHMHMYMHMHIHMHMHEKGHTDEVEGGREGGPGASKQCKDANHRARDFQSASRIGDRSHRDPPRLCKTFQNRPAWPPRAFQLEPFQVKTKQQKSSKTHGIMKMFATSFPNAHKKGELHHQEFP